MCSWCIDPGIDMVWSAMACWPGQGAKITEAPGPAINIKLGGEARNVAIASVANVSKTRCARL